MTPAGQVAHTYVFAIALVCGIAYGPETALLPLCLALLLMLALAMVDDY